VADSAGAADAMNEATNNIIDWWHAMFEARKQHEVQFFNGLHVW